MALEPRRDVFKRLRNKLSKVASAPVFLLFAEAPAVFVVFTPIKDPTQEKDVKALKAVDEADEGFYRSSDSAHFHGNAALEEPLETQENGSQGGTFPWTRRTSAFRNSVVEELAPVAAGGRSS